MRSSLPMSNKQRRSSSLSGDEGSFVLLPEDLIASEILVKLAVKPLFQFKCVSKQYNFIISDPKWGDDYLQRAYSSHQSRSSSGLSSSLMYPFTNQTNHIDHIGNTSIPITFVSLPRAETHKILGSSSGLILSLFHPQSQSQSQLQVESRFRLCVSNPLTKQSVELPELNDALQINYCDNFLFGIAAKRVEQATPLTYKVVLIRKVSWKDDGSHNPETKTSTYIFSSDTGSWATREQVACPRDVFLMVESIISYKATLHWVCCSRSDALITYDPFDSPDTFGRIPLPSKNRRIFYKLRLRNRSRSSTGVQCIVYLGEQQGLGFVQFTRRNREMLSSHTWKMWQLKSENDKSKSSWCTLPTKSVIPSMPYLCGRLLVAPDPLAPDVVCHPFVLDNKLTVFHSDSGRDPPVTREVVDMVLETPEGFREGGYWNPLIPLHLCPWASPSFRSTAS